MTVTPASIAAPLADALEAVLHDRLFWRSALDPLRTARQVVRGLAVEFEVALADDRDRLANARLKQRDPAHGHLLLELTCDVIDGDESTIDLNVYDNRTWITLGLESRGSRMRAMEVSLPHTRRIVDACDTARATHEDMQKAIAQSLLRTVLTTLLAICRRTDNMPDAAETERMVAEQATILDALLAVVIEALPETLRAHGPLPLSVSRETDETGAPVLALANPHSDRHPLTMIALTPFFADMLRPPGIRQATTSAQSGCLAIQPPTSRNGHQQPTSPVDAARLVRRVPHDQVEIVRRAVRGMLISS